MPTKEIGELRRSTAIGTFGPGAVVDFRASDAPVSAVVSGLEEWDRNFRPPGLRHPQSIHEPRLQRKLSVKGFRLPPVRDPTDDRDKEHALVAARFPHWLQCPKCDRIGEERKWAGEPGDAARWCADCRERQPGRRKVFVVPVRFITACAHGHLDDFPWHMWVNHLENCENRNGFLHLRAESAGLAGLVLSCEQCRQRRSLDGIFSTERRIGLPRCRGKRPWIADGDEQCQAPDTVRTMQRGASNLYFPVVESALSIPPWSDRLQEAMGSFWSVIATQPLEQRPSAIRMMENYLAEVLEELGLTPEQLSEEIEQRLQASDEINIDDLRQEEYRQLNAGVPVQGADREFEVRPRTVPDSIRPWVSRLVKAVRLREVRAMQGFTRIDPPGDPAAPNVARLSAAPLDWLPAIEVRGEGIFLVVDEERLTQWEVDSVVVARAADVHRQYVADWLSRNGADSPPPRRITARFLLLHTFAHALMRQLTLDCGYSSTALRERLYVGNGDTPMSGVLIYTATSDDDGTLGGLQRQGDPERIGRTVVAAIRAQAWCSSDPLCIEGMLRAEDSMSLAACHACVLAPETACEEFNRFLDRALLVGTPDRAETGFFSGLLAGQSV